MSKIKFIILGYILAICFNGCDLSMSSNDDDFEVHPGALEVCSGEDMDCDGDVEPCSSCDEILEVGSSTGDGVYAIAAGAHGTLWVPANT